MQKEISSFEKKAETKILIKKKKDSIFAFIIKKKKVKRLLKKEGKN